MKIYDFDGKFFEYVQVQLAMQPGLREDEVEGKYNQMLNSWLNAPAQWLGGVRPVEYFNRYRDPRDLIKLLEEYSRRKIGLPEPLYSRIVEVGEPCADALTRIAGDRDRSDELRATALALLNDMGSTKPLPLYMDLICSASQPNELSEMACDAIKAMERDVTEDLLERYPAASTYAQNMILDICAHKSGGERIRDLLIERLRLDTDNRGLYAGLLADVGDPRALEALKAAEQLTDLNYLDYLEIRNAIEVLGGEPDDLREFNGDPAYEAIRNL